MIHHISFGVTNLETAARFYDAALAPLGYVRVWEDLDPGKEEQAVGYGRPGGNDSFALKLRKSGAHSPGLGFHLAFSADNQEAVQRFHALAILNGGRDNGPPGTRYEYGPNYYAAFVFDPDGYRVEAVVTR